MLSLDHPLAADHKFQVGTLSARRFSLTITRSILISILCLSCVPTLTGDEAPPDTPDDLEQLLGFIFEHMRDERPVELKEGLKKLKAWYKDEERLESARVGFTIQNLNSEAVGLLDDEERTTSGLKGISVTTKSDSCPRGIAGLITWAQFGDLISDQFDRYERTFETPSSCFWKRDCLWLRADSSSQSKWAGVVKINTEYAIEFRWVDLDGEWAFLHRFWLKSPASGDSFGVKMNANYYIGITLPDGAREASSVSRAFIEAANGTIGRSGTEVDLIRETLSAPGALRIHGNWFQVDTGMIPLSDEALSNILLQNQRNDSERHDAMLAQYAIPGECGPDADCGEGLSAESASPVGGLEVTGGQAGDDQAASDGEPCLSAGDGADVEEGGAND